MVEYRNDPEVFLYGDGDEAFARARLTAKLAGLRVAGMRVIGEAGDSAEPPAARPIVEAGLETPALIALLDKLQREATELGLPAVVAAPAGLVDLVFARAGHPAIELLVDADERARVEAYASVAMPWPDQLHDVGREGQELLQKLSEDVGRLANMLASLSDEEAAELVAARPSVGAEEREDGLEPGEIRALIRARRLRDQYFSGELFADPAWDMLLDLMAARLERKRVAVSSLCIAAAVPATTALRWIKVLTDRGLFVRSADPQDGRRVYIELSDETARALAAYLLAAKRIAPAAI
ncbi:MAG: hypothetical protein ACT4N8_14870 [Sphingosinicella sp.]|uniref:hypothetical protein n=1 Tax=Sphingosinicella sp. TaxID=1917971 RepID=UPI004037EADF